ncbi:hypothetical protein DT594_04800 [Halopseudomonas laoshanensis]|uniref:Uncharacterized protein n=1 Tax=Halopseudomonas laoshanensis TaxID=2268758 RepID=A0A7V7GWS9_9GAMM|nr:hypothetical protein DT594_04800 [Halopseudomonas laoshanensis]
MTFMARTAALCPIPTMDARFREDDEIGKWRESSGGCMGPPQNPVIPAQAGIQAEYGFTLALSLNGALFTQPHINPSK